MEELKYKNWISLHRHSFAAHQSTFLDKASMKIDLENFNPLNPQRKLSSPRSIEICKANGISPDKIFYSTYAKIKESLSPLKRKSEEYLKMKYIETESSRQRLVAKLKEMRKVLIKQENMHRNIITRSFSTASSHTNRRGLIQLARRSIYLDNHPIRRERQISKKRTDKEISIIIYGSMKNIILKPLSKHKRSQDSKPNLHYKKIRGHIDKSKLLDQDIHKERRDVMERIEEYKREVLERKIQSDSYKANSVQRKKEELLKLRQQMRKNAIMQKYLIKMEIEKGLKVCLVL